VPLKFFQAMSAVAEKEMFRKSHPLRRFLPSISTLYWLSSGYGERPVRAEIFLLLVLINCSEYFYFREGEHPQLFASVTSMPFCESQPWHYGI